MKQDTGSRQKRVKIVSIQGIMRASFDIWLDGKLKRVYERTTAEPNDIKISSERVVSKAQILYNEKKSEYLAGVPKKGTLEDYVRYYIRGIASFDCDVLDVSNVLVDDSAVTIRSLLKNSYASPNREKALKQSDYLIKHTICKSKINKTITSVTVEDINRFLKIIADYYMKDIVDELYGVIGRTFSMTNRLGITKLDFSAVTKPQECEKKAYYLDRKELRLLKQCCLEETLPKIFIPQYLHLLTLSYFTGKDAKEFLNMRGADISYDKKQIVLGGVPLKISDACISWLKMLELKENKKFEKHLGLVFDFSQDRKSFNYYRKYKDTMTKIYFYLALPVCNHTEVMMSYILMKVFEDGASLDELKNTFYIYRPTFERNAEKYKEFKESQKDW